MSSVIAVLASITALGVAAAPSGAGPTFICHEGVLRSGPQKGAQMRINAKHAMTCQQVTHAIAIASFSKIDHSSNHLSFRLVGFRCRVVNLFYQARFVVGEEITCAARNRSFTFDWGPIAIPDQ